MARESELAMAAAEAIERHRVLVKTGNAGLMKVAGLDYHEAKVFRNIIDDAERSVAYWNKRLKKGR